MTVATPAKGDVQPGAIWRIRIVFIVFIAIAVSVVWVTNFFLTARFTETTRNEAEVRVALYTGNLLTELQRNAVVPLLLARDPTLIGALTSEDFSQSSTRLIDYRDEIGAAEIVLLDSEGRTVAATERNQLGSAQRNTPFFVSALRSNDTVFTTTQADSGRFDFSFSRKIHAHHDHANHVAIDLDLAR
ncbi:MAG: sensor histidine kinase, partial [Pseudomonadota bacterium]